MISSLTHPFQNFFIVAGLPRVDFSIGKWLESHCGKGSALYTWPSMQRICW